MHRPSVDEAVFFMGSLLFTSAATLQWLETVNANRGPAPATGQRLKVLTFEPSRIDVSGYLAYVELSGHLLGRPRRTRESAIATVNLLGCLAFGVSAVASYIVPSTGSEVSLTLVNLCTAFGALCFLIGALLLLPEGALERESAPAQ